MIYYINIIRRTINSNCTKSLNSNKYSSISVIVLDSISFSKLRININIDFMNCSYSMIDISCYSYGSFCNISSNVNIICCKTVIVPTTNTRKK